MGSGARQVTAGRPGIEMVENVGAQSFAIGIVLTSLAVGEVRPKARLTGAGGLATHPA